MFCLSQNLRLNLEVIELIPSQQKTGPVVQSGNILVYSSLQERNFGKFTSELLVKLKVPLN